MRWGLLVLGAFVLACGDDDARTDASTPPCARDSDCDDGLFCNGEERCEGSACTPGSSPCADTSCLESEARCDASCVDVDGDGHADGSCGGTDCDDADETRFPGASEVCDAFDDDCDPMTLGDVDADGDGEVAAACCNGERCGTDCDDTDLARRSRQIEVCDGKDNDCDGRVDEETSAVPWYPDTDGDGFGDGSMDGTTSCSPVAMASLLGTDCDDSDASVSPVGTERCGGGDEDCDGVVDEDCGGTDAGPRDGGVDAGRLDGGAGDGGPVEHDEAMACTVGTICPSELGTPICFGAYGSATACHVRCDDDTLASDEACGAAGPLRRCSRIPGIPSTSRVCTLACDPILQTGCLGDDVCDLFGGSDAADEFASHAECRGVGVATEGMSCSASIRCARGLTCAGTRCRAICTSADTTCATGTCSLYDEVLPNGRFGFCRP